METAICDYVKMDDLPEDLRMLAEEVGLKAVAHLVSTYAGEAIYIPRSARQAAMARYVAMHYDGTNARALARRLGISERGVYRILAIKVTL